MQDKNIWNRVALVLQNHIIMHNTIYEAITLTFILLCWALPLVLFLLSFCLDAHISPL